MEKFYFVQLPWGPWTIAKRADDGRWWLANGDNNPVILRDGDPTEYFKAIGDEIPVPQ